MPSQNDDVYFDANSGFLSGTIGDREVTLGVGTNTCRNMIWDNTIANAYLTGPNSTSTLHIYGSLELQAGMVYRVANTYFKSKNSGETIRTNGVSIGVTYSSLIGHIFFDGDGDWTLLDDLETGGGNATSRINLIKGGFNTNGFTVRIHSFISVGDEARALTLGSSYIYLRCGSVSGSGWTFIGTNKTMNAGSSQIIFTNAFLNPAFFLQASSLFSGEKS